MTHQECLSQSTLIPIAHRGGRLEAAAQGMPENSIAAFHYAVDLGYAHIETDVRATEDGDLFVWHGEGMERFDKKTPLKRRDIDSLRYNGERAVPLLSEVLEEFPDTHFAIDPKHVPAVEPLAKVLVTSGATSRVSVGAFSQVRTDMVRSRVAQLGGGDVCTGMGTRGVARLIERAFANPARTWQSADILAQLPRSIVNARVVQAAHAGGVKVHVWTVNGPTWMKEYIKMGVDGIMTDQPTLLKDVLTEQNMWAA